MPDDNPPRSHMRPKMHSILQRIFKMYELIQANSRSYRNTKCVHTLERGRKPL